MLLPQSGNSALTSSSHPPGLFVLFSELPSPQPILLHGTALYHIEEFTLALIELHEFCLSSLLQCTDVLNVFLPYSGHCL